MSGKNVSTAWWKENFTSPAIYSGQHQLSSQYVAMADGVRLAVDLYLPKDLRSGHKLPAILIQTRYHRRPLFRAIARPIFKLTDPFRATLAKVMSCGYAFVVVDVRGAGASFGSRRMEWSPEETKDSGQIVNWIVAQPWSNGLVGVTGISYVGTAAEMTLRNRCTAVKAAHIRFAPFDIFADLVCPGGVRNLEFLKSWSALTEALDRNELPDGDASALRRLYGLAVCGVAPVDEDRNGKLLQLALQDHKQNYKLLEAALSVEFRDDVGVNGVTFDQFSPHAFIEEIGQAGAAIHCWSSYYDGANVLSAVKRFLNVQAPDRRLVLGPWDHGGIQNPDPFNNERKSRFDQFGAVLRYFDYHLKGIANGIEKEKPVYYYTMGEEVWKSADTWPPPDFTLQSFYLGDHRRLSLSAPTDDAGVDEYRVDCSATSGPNSRWVSLVNEPQVRIGYTDRREQDKKLLVYQTNPLEQDLEVTGHPVVKLYIRSTATDGQFFVYLEDVSPTGEVNYITEGLCRAINRMISQELPYRLPDGVPPHSFKRSDARPLTAETNELVFDLLPVSHLFRASHAIRLAIAGADRDNFELLTASPPQIAVFRNKQYPSQLQLPVLIR